MPHLKENVSEPPRDRKRINKFLLSYRRFTCYLFISLESFHLTRKGKIGL